jgi:hypothetical protein
MNTTTTRPVRQVPGLAVAALALAAPVAPSRAAMQPESSIMTMKQDLADREKDIHWLEDFHPSQTDLFSH